MSISIYMGITNPNIGNGDAKDNNATFKLLSLSFSAVAPVTSLGVASGRASMSAITVTLNALLAPQLLASLLDHDLHEVTFTIEKSNTKNLLAEYEQIVLTEALITLFQETVSNADLSPTLELTFSYRKLTFSEANNGGTVTYSPGELG